MFLETSYERQKQPLVGPGHSWSEFEFALEFVSLACVGLAH